MSNELVKRMDFSEMQQMGKVFAESGMFVDAKSAAQAIVKIQAGQEMGIPPFAAMGGIHIIQGKPAVGAGLMAATVKGNGKYDYKVVKLDDVICSIDFYKGKELLGNSTFTIEDAKKAQTKNLDKYPKNMLFARAMSNGVKWFTPDVFNGPVYTPDELGENITEDTTATITTVEPIVVKKGISEKAFNTAVERIKNNEVGLVDKLEDTYTLTEEQQTIINSLKAL